jgi:hypothetical protein
MKGIARGPAAFGLYDPSGTWVDVVQQIDPAPGFWDRGWISKILQ